MLDFEFKVMSALGFWPLHGCAFGLFLLYLCVWLFHMGPFCLPYQTLSPQGQRLCFPHLQCGDARCVWPTGRPPGVPGGHGQRGFSASKWSGILFGKRPAVPRSRKRRHMTLCQKVFLAMLSRSFHRKMILCNGYLVILTTKAWLKWWNLKKTMTV